MIKPSLKNYFFLFLPVLFFLIYNFYFDPGYWYDEWATLFSSDPTIPLHEIYLRINGVYQGIYTLGSEENVPPYYYLFLRFFFSIFGFTTENGRVFSVIFFILTIFIFIPLSKLVLGKHNNYLAVFMLSLNPLILWMANETRVDTFILFFSTLNIYIFLKSFHNQKISQFIYLFFSNIAMLSIYPLSFSIFFSQIVFLLYQLIFSENKSKILIVFCFLSFIFYLIFNYDYLVLKFGFERPHFAKLELNFFFGYFFNIFFGNKYFGGVYLLLCLILLVKNFKSIFINETIRFLSIVIISSYSMVVISSLYFTPIASPRYIIFVIPVLVLWFMANLSLLKKFKKRKLAIIFMISFPILNILATHDDRPVKKPPIREALSIIEGNNVKNIYVPYSKYYYLYVSRIGNVVSKKFKLININDIYFRDAKEFAHLCMNNPRFAVGNLILPDEEKCNIRFDNYNVIKIKKIDDFIIIFFRIKQF